VRNGNVKGLIGMLIVGCVVKGEGLRTDLLGVAIVPVTGSSIVLHSVTCEWWSGGACGKCRRTSGWHDEQR